MKFLPASLILVLSALLLPLAPAQAGDIITRSFGVDEAGNSLEGYVYQADRRDLRRDRGTLFHYPSYGISGVITPGYYYGGGRSYYPSYRTTRVLPYCPPVHRNFSGNITIQGGTTARVTR